MIDNIELGVTEYFIVWFNESPVMEYDTLKEAQSFAEKFENRELVRITRVVTEQTEVLI